MIFASFDNAPFENGYVAQKDLLGIPNGSWKELFNSDAIIYGGRGVGNAGASISSYDGRIEAKIPANGFVILSREG